MGKNAHSVPLKWASKEELASAVRAGTIPINTYRLAMDLPPVDKNHCQWCGEYIEITIFRGDGWCSDDHRKLIQGSQD